MTRAQYAAYLRSPEWRERRAAVLRRARGRCEDCIVERQSRGLAGVGMAVSAAEHIHHETYARLGREWIEDLVALCDRHHRARHGIPPARAAK